MMTRSKTPGILLALALIAVIVAACTPSATPTATSAPTATATASPTSQPLATATVGVVPDTTAGERQAQGQIRIVQAAPQSGAVDVYLEQGLIASRLGLGAYTNPLTIEAGTYYLQVVPVGALPDTQILAEATIDLAPDQSVLLLITGTADALTIATYPEDLSAVPAEESRLTFIHAVPRGPAFTPYIDDEPLGEALDYGDTSTGYSTVAGAHRIALLADDGTILADLDTALAARQFYTAVLVGQVGGGNYRILLLNTPVEIPGMLRFIHANPEAEAVRVILDDRVLGTDFTYRTASEWTSLPARTYRLRVMPAAAETEAAPLVETQFNLSADQALELLFYQERGAPALRIFTTSLAPTPPLTARLVVVNTAPDAPAVYAQSGDELLSEIPPVPYGTATRIIDFPAGLANLFWATGQGTNARLVEIVGDYTFSEGKAYTYIVTGAERDPFVLIDEVGTEADTDVVSADTDDGLTADDNAVAVRAINALADPLTVRLRLDDSVLFDSLAARTESDYTAVRQGEYTLRIGPAGDSPNTPDYYIGDLSLLDLARLSLLLYGPPETMQVTVAPDYDQPVLSSQAILRVLNATTDQENLRVTIDLPGIAPTVAPDSMISPEGTPIALPETPQGRFETYESRAFDPGETTGFIGLPVGTYDIQVSNALNNEVIAIIPGLALEGRTLYDLVLLPGTDGSAIDIELFIQESGF